MFDQNIGYYNGGAIGTQPYDTLYTGGIIPSNTAITVSDCVFTNNFSLYGSAVCILDSFPVTFTRCIFKGNSAAYSGVFYDTAWSRTEIYNSLIVGNAANSFPIYFCGPVKPGVPAFPHTLIHCTIADNQSNSTSKTDFAIQFNGHDVIQNCIFWKNKTGSGLVMDTPAAGNYISTNIIEGSPGLPNTVNTYDFDPLFMSPGTGYAIPFPSAAVFDYRLKIWSPAIDTGLTGTVTTGPDTIDLDSNNRFWGFRTDLGSYERQNCYAKPPTIISSKGLIFCQPDSVKLTAMATGPGTFYWNGTGTNPIWAKDSGIYHVIRDSAGCISKNSVLVKAIPVPSPTITLTNNTLSVPSIYASYQWYKAGVLIPGATSASYNPSSNGVYTVAVTTVTGRCPGTSTAYNLTNLGIGIGKLPEGVSIFPNPFTNVIVVEDALGTIGSIKIYDLQGRVLTHLQVKEKTTIMAIDSKAPGIYIIRLQLKNGECFSKSLIKGDN